MPSTRLLTQALLNAGAEVEELSGEKWRPILGHAKAQLDVAPDTRVISRLGWLSFRRGLRWVQAAEAAGLHVYNSSASLLCAHDKFSTAARLQQQGLKVVPTLLVRPDHDDVLEVLRRQDWRPPLVAKLLHGSQGKGVALLRESRDLEAWVDLLRTANREFLIQPLIQAPEFRALVIDEQVLVVAQKSATGDDFRANYHRQGEWKLVSVAESEQKTLAQACRALGLDMAGVDYFREGNQISILEINPFPGWEGLTKLKPTLPEKIAKTLMEKSRA